MRLYLLPWIYRIHPAPSIRERWRGWRLRWYGVGLFEKCECDNVQDCVMYRWHGAYEWVDEDGAQRYDPRDECECRDLPPHRHSRIGYLIDKPLRLR